MTTPYRMRRCYRQYCALRRRTEQPRMYWLGERIGLRKTSAPGEQTPAHDWARRKAREIGPVPNHRFDRSASCDRPRASTALRCAAHGGHGPSAGNDLSAPDDASVPSPGRRSSIMSSTARSFTTPNIPIEAASQGRSKFTSGRSPTISSRHSTSRQVRSASTSDQRWHAADGIPAARLTRAGCWADEHRQDRAGTKPGRDDPEFFTEAVARDIVRDYGHPERSSPWPMCSRTWRRSAKWCAVWCSCSTTGSLYHRKPLLARCAGKQPIRTVYHEHIRTYSLKALVVLSSYYGLEVFDVERA